MDIYSSVPYLIGKQSVSGPLARFLPPIVDNVLTAWLQASVTTKGWLLDPFGASPQWAVEAARAGYRIITTVNNPVNRFALEMMAAPHSSEEFIAAMADLAASRKGDERLDTHIQNLYLTRCTECERLIPAQAFLWRKDEPYPYARIYECPNCKKSGEYLITEQDKKRLDQLKTTASLHRSRVLERVAPLNDPDRDDAEQAINHYLPRSVYALSTLINRLDNLQTPPERRRALTALLLHAFDQGNVLWGHPTERARPRQLVTPSQYREQNLWMALEQGIALWTDSRPSIPITLWPELPPENGGICIFEGPLRDLAEHLDEISIQAVVSVLPRPNQAFWTLSALWAGWLWGPDAIAPFKSVLRRKRYDWQWHANALWAAFHHLEALAPGMPFFALLPEPEPGFLSAALIAAATAGFELAGLGLRTQHDPVQIHWLRGETAANADLDIPALRKQVQEYLTLRDEPTTYLHVHAAGLAGLATDKKLSPQPQPADSLPLVQSAIQQALTEGKQFDHFTGTENPETGYWGLSKPPDDADPLSDQVEIAVVRFLQRNPECTFETVLTDVNQQLQGLLTPSEGLVRAVLDSYGEEVEERWRLRLEDFAAARRADLDAFHSTLEQVGSTLGYQVEYRESPRPLVLWKENHEIVHGYALLASAVIGRLLRQSSYPPEKMWLVLPGGRAGLVDYKLRRDPSLRFLVGDGWHFLKFRHLRRISQLPVINRNSWTEQLNSDPIDGLEQQIAMF